MQNEEIEEGISIQELFDSIFSRLPLVILVLVVSVSLAAVYLHYAVKQYQTTVTMIIEPITKTSTIGKILSTDFFNSSNDISTEIHLITNITNLEAAARKLDLSSYENSKGLPYSEPGVLGGLKGKTAVNNFKGTNIVELSVTDENPTFAADFANAIALSFNEMISLYGKESKQAQIEFLERQIPATEQELDEANDKLFDYKATTGIVFLSNSTASLVNHISYLQMRKKPLQLQVVKSEALLTGFQQAYGNTMPSLAVYENDQAIQEILEIYGMAFDELIQFDVVSNNDYRNTTSLSVVNGTINESVNARIDTLNRQMAESRKQLTRRVLKIAADAGMRDTVGSDDYYYEVNNYGFTIVERLCNEVDIVAITKTIETFEQEFNTLPLLEKDLSKLQSDVDSLEAIRKELNSLLEQITLSAAAQNNNVKLVTPARIPRNPVSPNSLLILAVSLLLGGALGVLLCLFLQMKDDRLHSFDDIKKIAGSEIPLLGWVPLIDTQKNPNKKRCLKSHYKNPDSYISERYSAIVSNIRYGKNSNKKVFLVTSSNTNEGKTSLACNISIHLAQLGHKVLIVDCDVKRPSVGKFFDLKKGLSGYVEMLHAGKSIHKICVSPLEDVPNLDVLVPGHSSLIPSVFYSKTTYTTMFESLKDRYDYILLDAPPFEFAYVLKGLFAQVDGIILCVRLSICSKTNLANLIGQLEEYNDKISGIIPTGCALSLINSYTNKNSYYHHRYLQSKTQSKDSDTFSYIQSEKKAIRIFKKDLREKRYSRD
ncbi:MAG: polysaccharide biosynthesis tyrosine autokinase [Sphaerochaeta sp.]|nr:polysaccharide biosynthesis tyrosine autokinase [Sphaerochaeta sp.]